MECSAKTGEGVDEIFTTLLKDIQSMGGATKDKDISVFSDVKGFKNGGDGGKRATLRGDDLLNGSTLVQKKKRGGCC